MSGKKLIQELKELAEKFGFKLDKEEGGKAGKFLLAFAGVFLLLNFLSLLVPLQLIELVVAETAGFPLTLLGLNSKIVLAEPVKMVFSDRVIEISYLCIGLLEFLILASSIIASLGIPWKKRVLGVFAASIATFSFNLLRIDATILLINWFGLGIGNLGHEVFFRLSLFVVIAGFYWAWFKWATKKR